MGKFGHYIAGLSVVSVLSGAAVAEFEAKNQDNENNENKIEYAESRLAQDMKNACKQGAKAFAEFLSVIGKKNGIFSSKEERCNFLAKERQKRVEMEKIHGKTIDSSQSVKKADSEHIKEIHINDLLKMSGRG